MNKHFYSPSFIVKMAEVMAENLEDCDTIKQHLINTLTNGTLVSDDYLSDPATTAKRLREWRKEA